MMETAAVRRFLGPYGASYEGAIDLESLRRAFPPYYTQRTQLTVDGNVAASIPFLQWWRAPIAAGFPITPATKWLEYLAAMAASGHYDVQLGGKKVRLKRVKLLESEHAAADYITGVAAACRGLVVGTATSSVGLDHMTESVRSLGASGLGNVMIVNVCRSTANYPLCIEGDSSDTLAHRDSGLIQVVCRGKQQIYDTLLQLPAVGMHPEVLTPTMPAYYGIKDSHRNGNLWVETDESVNAFLEEALAMGRKQASSHDFLEGNPPAPRTPPGLLDGDTSMGNCVTSAYFQGFKVGQKARFQRALEVVPRVAKLFERCFGRPGIVPFEQFGMEDSPEAVLVAMGPDSGTAVHLLPELRRELKTRLGLVVMRLLTPFPSEAVGAALASAGAVGVVNNAHHHGRGHLTLDVVEALSSRGKAPPVEAFFCGLGGADVSMETWRTIARTTCEAASRGRASQRWHLLHDGISLEET